MFGQLTVEYSTVPQPTPCATCYVSADQLGTPRLVTDGNANLVARHDYLPFGEEIGANTAGRSAQWGPANDNVNAKFTGQERDSETGLDYFNARYMGTSLGRFVSPDPANAGADLTNPQTWNGYSYVGNSSLTNVDPTGESFWSILGDILSLGLKAILGGGGGLDHGGGINTRQIIIGAIGTGIEIGTHAGGSGGHAGGSATPPSAPSVSNWPAGETLGLPTGMNIPGSLSPGDPLIIQNVGPNADPRFWNFDLASSTPGNWARALKLLNDFLTGGGDTRRIYNSNDPEGADLMRSGGFQSTVRQACQSHNAGGPFNVGTKQAADNLSHDAKYSPTGVQVGGYVGSYTFKGTSMHVSLANNAGTHSFFYHLLPDSPFSTGPFRTINQRFELNIPYPCGTSW